MSPVSPARFDNTGLRRCPLPPHFRRTILHQRPRDRADLVVVGADHGYRTAVHGQPKHPKQVRPELDQLRLPTAR